MRKIYRILDEAAAARGLSRKKLAEQLQMSPELYAQKHTGRSMLTVEQLHSVAQFLGFSMETVYDLERC